LRGRSVAPVLALGAGLEEDGLGDGLPQRLGRLHGALEVRAGEDHDELVAAVAREERRRGRLAREQLRHLLQRQLPRGGRSDR